MEPQPSEQSQTPGYPTQTELAAEPDVLDAHVPRGWQTGKVLASAVALLAAAGIPAYCGDAKLATWGAEGTRGRPPIISDANNWVRSIFDGRPTITWDNVQTMGLMAIDTCSEDEAQQVIEENLERDDP